MTPCLVECLILVPNPPKLCTVTVVFDHTFRTTTFACLSATFSRKRKPRYFTGRKSPFLSTDHFSKSLFTIALYMLELEQYDISTEFGFLTELPLERLTNPYYNPWEKFLDNLNAYILHRTVRKQVNNKLPHLSIDKLANEREMRRAYLVLSFLGHAYIWSGEPVDRLPAQISDPWIAVSKALGLPPIATYAAVCLWNFKKIDESGEFTLDNLTTINTFTGSVDESWFYLVLVCFEKEGAFSVKVGLDALNSAETGNTHLLIENLQQFAESIDMLGSVLMRMEEMCDPHVFYFRIRPFLAGWKNMASVGLEKGVYYGDETTPRSYAGGSNAQSSLIQFMDILLGVSHHATGDLTADSSFLTEMREYMPKKHREFLQDLEPHTFTIRDFVKSQNNEELTLAYDACLAMLKSFRDKHIQIVTRYVVLQAKKSQQDGFRIHIEIRFGQGKERRERNRRYLSPSIFEAM